MIAERIIRLLSLVSKGEKLMSEENKGLARQFFRMLETGDPGMADEIVSADYINHDAPDPNLGSEGVKAGVTRFKKAFPDAQVKIAFQVAEGDKVVSRYSWSGTHEGEFVGIPATGKQVHWTATITFRIVDGKIREAWYNMDRLGLMQQLGVVATLGQSGS
jgi:steroid delta-isomerase-like uncharacterized protein